MNKTAYDRILWKMSRSRVEGSFSRRYDLAVRHRQPLCVSLPGRRLQGNLPRGDHRYHIVRSTKYRFKVLRGDIRLRVRDICRQVCRERGVDIIRGVLSADHVHMVVSVPPRLAISDLVRLMEGRFRAKRSTGSFLLPSNSHKVQREFPQLRKRYWGRRFWRRGYFSTTNGAITEDIVLQYLEQHIADPTGASR
jgi:putative transposase